MRGGNTNEHYANWKLPRESIRPDTFKAGRVSVVGWNAFCNGLYLNRKLTASQPTLHTWTDTRQDTQYGRVFQSFCLHSLTVRCTLWQDSQANSQRFRHQEKGVVQSLTGKWCIPVTVIKVWLIYLLLRFLLVSFKKKRKLIPLCESERRSISVGLWIIIITVKAIIQIVCVLPLI